MSHLQASSSLVVCLLDGSRYIRKRWDGVLVIAPVRIGQHLLAYRLHGPFASIRSITAAAHVECASRISRNLGARLIPVLDPHRPPAQSSSRSAVGTIDDQASAFRRRLQLVQLAFDAQ